MVDTTFASAMLVAWVPLSVLVYATLGARTATIVVLLGAPLLLPARISFDFPGLPPLDRELIASASALGCCLFAAPRALRAVGWGRGYLILLFLLSAGALVTALTNSDAIVIADQVRPGMTAYDGLSLAVQELLFFGIPFALGLALFRRPSDLALLLALLAAAMLVYSALILWEVRMSPQIHRNVYGYHPHLFMMSKRLGGWRPMVFVGHGHVLARFVLIAALAGVVLARARLRVFQLPAFPVGLYLAAVLALCRSLAALTYGAVALPLGALLRPALQARMAALLALAIVAYPFLRIADAVPTDALVEAAKVIDEDRADSLAFRFENEDLLLGKFERRAWFGWGSWGRNRVYAEDTGKDLTIPDGFWIVILGHQGVVGFLGSFGLLLMPVIAAARSMRRISLRRDRVLVAGLAWIIAVNAIDLLPNSAPSAVFVFLSGALAGSLLGAASPRPDPASRGEL